MSKYKELKANYDKLAKSYCDAITEIQKYKTQLEELEKNNKQLMNNSKYEKMRFDQLIGINNVNADVIQFLAARKFGDNPAIEFAAIKTYRGWETLYLHGEELNPSGKDVTIWAENNEAVRVEVSGS